MQTFKKLTAYSDAKCEWVSVTYPCGDENAQLKAENAKLRELVTMIWRTARLMDANEHIDGMRITDEFRASCEIAFAELGIEVDG